MHGLKSTASLFHLTLMASSIPSQAKKEMQGMVYVSLDALVDITVGLWQQVLQAICRLHEKNG